MSAGKYIRMEVGDTAAVRTFMFDLSEIEIM